jgi:hypothetical protein
MAKQTKSTQESAKPKKPLVNWFSRTKTKSAVTDSIAPDSSVISYNKKTVTAPASILGGGAMKKEQKTISKSNISPNEKGTGTAGYLEVRNKSKEGQKEKKYSRFIFNKHKQDDTSHVDTRIDKVSESKFRKPTKLLAGTEKSRKDSMYQSKNDKDTIIQRGIGKGEGSSWGVQMYRSSGTSESSSKKLGLPKNTEKSMKASFDNMKSAPEYTVKKKKSNKKDVKEDGTYGFKSYY